MKKIESVEEYIETHPKWEALLLQIRELCISTVMEETVKWSIPTYTVNGKNVLGIGAFKNHVGIWFFQGVFLTDKHQKLTNAQDGKTKAMRQWKVTSNEVLDSTVLKAYIQEAIENQLQGKEVAVVRNKPLVIPELLQNFLTNNITFKKAFEKLTKGKQREYCNYISEAKRVATKEKRLQKIIPLVQDGKGLYDHYKNC